MSEMSPAARAALLALLWAGCAAAQAQSSCASDGQPRPVALLERFINADCESCWADPATPKAGPKELALDWVLPGGKGEDAALSAVALRDALERLQALGRPPAAAADAQRTPAGPGAGRLRTAHGLPFNGYLGTSIELKPAQGGPWTAWLALVETVPAGTEGSPVERNLVRNTLQLAWSGKGPWRESRPMSIPPGANPERLRLVGWVQDSRGRIRGIARTGCTARPAGG